MMHHRVRLAGVVGAAMGVALFVWALRAAGVAAVTSAVERLGAGFLVVVALGGLRHLVRASAWRLCFEDPATLSLGWSLAAYLAGDAIGNVTPFGVLASEPSKIVLLRGRVDSSLAIPALALENLMYGATVVLMLIAGTVALLAAFDVTAGVRTASLIVVAAGVAAVMAAALIAHARPALVRPLTAFVRRHRDRVGTIAALEIAYHVAAVFEIWIAILMITGHPTTVLAAFVLECVNRTITVGFQFVPLWLGVDEAGTGLMTSALGLTGATGVALAIARKARVLAWTAIGLLLVGIFRRRPVFTSGQNEDRHRWRDGLPGTSAGRGIGR